MHKVGIVLTSWLVTALSVFGVTLPAEWVLVGLLISVAIVGVPHGGLDHWAGRSLLSPSLKNVWWVAFFPTYLFVAMMVVAGWFVAPVATAISFFLLSAWHFGHEEMANEAPSFGKVLNSIASGGLVIWIPVLARPQDVGGILMSLVPEVMEQYVGNILTISQGLAIPLTACAVAFLVNDIRRHNYQRVIRHLSFGCLFCFADVLVSFGLYFCGWHSIRGLTHLANEHRLNSRQLLFAVAPLSIGAILLSFVGMWIWSSGQSSTATLHRTLFISLSAMAVPHLVLHGPITELARQITAVRRRSNVSVGTIS